MENQTQLSFKWKKIAKNIKEIKIPSYFAFAQKHGAALIKYLHTHDEKNGTELATKLLKAIELECVNGRVHRNAELELYLKPFEFIQQARMDITNLLMDATKEKHLVENLSRRSSTQTCLNQIIFNKDEVWGEVHLAIGTTLERWEVYCLSILTKNKRLKHSSRKGNLRLDSKDDIIGYYRASLEFAFADIFGRQKAQKRAATEVNFSSMHADTDNENERNFEDTLASTNSDEMIYRNHKRDMIQYLRNYDRKNKTRLAHLFVALVNPRYDGAITKIQKRLKLNTKALKDGQALLFKVLKAEFNDIASDIISFQDKNKGRFNDLEIENKVARKAKNRKKAKKDDLGNNPCRLNIIFGSRPINKKKCTYYGIVQLDQSKTKNIVVYSTDSWQNLFKKEVTVEGKIAQNTNGTCVPAEMKARLEKLLKKEIAEAQKILESKKSAPEVDDGDVIAA